MNLIIPKITIVILNWNGRQDTLECLESVQKIDYQNFETIVVDNGSQDDSVKTIREKFPQVMTIENGANLGFSAGNNVGIQYALSQGTDYVFLLNNDTVVDPQMLSELIDASTKYPEAGILGSKIYRYDKPETIWYAGTSWRTDTAKFLHIGYGKVDSQTDEAEVKETDYVCGCAFLIKTEVVEKVGMLDPKYFLLWEEADLCYRARKAGYKTLVVPKSQLRHKCSASFIGGHKAPHYQYFWWRNRFLWVEKNLSFAETTKVYPVIVKQIVKEVINYLKSQTNTQEKLTAKAALQGFRDYLLRKFGDCPASMRSQN